MKKEVETSPESGSSGAFAEEPQEAKEPTITIINGSDEDLKFTMEDVNGISQSTVISANTEKDFTVPAGLYQARIEGTNDPTITPMDGVLSVTNYHKYSHRFILSPDAIPHDFYVGDKK